MKGTDITLLSQPERGNWMLVLSPPKMDRKYDCNRHHFKGIEIDPLLFENRNNRFIEA
jgi:hypothetical protein